MGGDGVLSKYQLAVVCVLAFIIGGAAGLMFYHPPAGAADVRGVSEKGVEVAPGAGAATEAAASSAAEGAPAEEGVKRDVGGDSARLAGEGTEDGIGLPAVRAVKTAGGVKGRSEAEVRAGRRPRAARGYVRVSRAEGPSGERGVAGHTVSGVKKTGKLIVKTFGKIGGVFHD